MNKNAVELIEISKRFVDPSGQFVDAVKSISLEIGEGEFFSLLGPSGCGKTTTLRMIAGFETPTAGTIRIHDKPVENVEPHLRPVNTVFQSYALFPHMSIYDNVAFGLQMENVRKAEIKERVLNALDLVQLHDMEKRKPRQLSGGQQQRVALARALVKRPEVLLLDEPLGALDLKLRKDMQLELKQIQSQVGITFVYVTHDQEEALTMSDRIAVMHEGHILQIGTPSEIYERPTSRFVADFIGETNLIDGTVSTFNGETVQVQTASGLQLTAAQQETTFAQGQSVSFALRPEKLLVSDAPQPNLAHLSGTVEESVYIGTDTRMMVRIDDQNRLVARAQNTGLSSTPSYTKGQNVFLCWQPSAAQVLTD